jgi:diguanylate cyclase (GGDEF)-like protein
LDQSLTSLRESTEGRVYGADRDDELGDLSKTIQDLFAKANIDVLTGIYNRRFMENNLEQIMEMLSRSNGLLSVLMIDIDFFKKYNDAYGHDQGDICLKEVAHAMSSGIMRINDFAARYGGEEFVTVLPNTDENGACVVAEKLLEIVRSLNIEHSGSTVAPFVTVSVGVTTGRVTYGQNWKSYIKRADEALYMSKKNNRNQYTFLEM